MPNALETNCAVRKSGGGGGGDTCDKNKSIPNTSFNRLALELLGDGRRNDNNDNYSASTMSLSDFSQIHYTPVRAATLYALWPSVLPSGYGVDENNIIIIRRIPLERRHSGSVFKSHTTATSRI